MWRPRRTAARRGLGDGAVAYRPSADPDGGGDGGGGTEAGDSRSASPASGGEPAEHAGLEPGRWFGRRGELEEAVGYVAHGGQVVAAAGAGIDMGEDVGALAAVEDPEGELGGQVLALPAGEFSHGRRLL